MSTRRYATLCVLVLVLAAGACATAARVLDETPRGVPGFDTRDYPGDAVMRSWFAESPYRWTGYYLPAPCYTGTTWTGRRAALRDIGWGFAVVFVGEQDWRAMGRVDSAAVAQPRCSSTNLNPDKARADADAAIAAAAGDGFPAGTVIFLDVERVDSVSAGLRSYAAAWFDRILTHGRFVPGLYAHDVNTPALYTLLAESFARVGHTQRPLLWVAHSGGFGRQRAPAESGYPVAAVWQGIFNIRETWGGATLNIDVNVADTADPSRGR